MHVGSIVEQLKDGFRESWGAVPQISATVEENAGAAHIAGSRKHSSRRVAFMRSVWQSYTIQTRDSRNPGRSHFSYLAVIECHKVISAIDSS
jgi:hypothetical protein